jgi:hypothetical protein
MYAFASNALSLRALARLLLEEAGLKGTHAENVLMGRLQKHMTGQFPLREREWPKTPNTEKK